MSWLCKRFYYLCINFIRGPTNNLDETVDVPPDKFEIDDKKRVLILKKISLCERNRGLLDTLVVDQLLCNFNDTKCFVFPTYSPYEPVL